MSKSGLKMYRGRIDLSEPNVPWVKIVNLVREGSRVLEIGCATGHMTEFLASKKRCHVTGVELNPEAAAIAAKWCEQIVTGNVEEGALDRISGPFDVVVFADVLEHLRDPGAVLRTIPGLLNEDGCVLISIPNVTHWDVRRDFFFGKFEYTAAGLLDSTHLRFFTRDSIERLIQECGFVIEQSDLIHHFPARWCAWGRCNRWSHRILTRKFPGLFAYQFIYQLRPKFIAAGPSIPAQTPTTVKAEKSWT